MHYNDPELFNRFIWHDSNLVSLRVSRNSDGLDEVFLIVQMEGISDQDLTPVTIVFEDSIFFFCDVDLQGKRECADHISSARCGADTELMAKIRKERLSAPDALAGYLHFSIYLIPPGGTIDVIARGFRVNSGASEDPG